MSHQPLIAPALVSDMCCPLLAVKESQSSLTLWVVSLHKLGPAPRLRKPCMTPQMERISSLAVSLPSAPRR